MVKAKPLEKNVMEIPNFMFELIDCPVCGGKEQSLYLKIRYGNLKQKKSLDYSALKIYPETWLYVKECNECGFVFVNPRVKKEFEKLIYNESKKPMYANKAGVYNPDSNEFLHSARKRRFDYLGPLLSAISYVDISQKSLSLFDYGSGSGHSMVLAKALGFDAYGVDIDAQRIKVCERLGLKVGTPEDFDEKYPDFSANVILCQSNIEHLVDLRGAFAYLKSKAKPGAILYVNGLTPRIIDREKKAGRFVKAHFVEHLNYFPIKTLDRFMAQYEFRPLRYRKMVIYRNYKEAFKRIAAFWINFLIPHVPMQGSFSRLYLFRGES